MKAERGAICESLDGKSFGSLMQINQCSAPFFGNAAQRSFQRGMAFASGRTEDVSHQAVRVHAHQHRGLTVLDVAANQGYMRLASVDFTLVSDQAKFAEARVDQSFAYASNVTLMRHAVANQLGDGQHLQSVLAAKFDKVRHASHAAIVFHDLADDACWDHARQPR